MDAEESHGAQINELREDLTSVSGTVGQLAEAVKGQSEKQARDTEDIKEMLRAALR